MVYNTSFVESLERDISDLIKSLGIQFFQVKKRVKLNNHKADLFFEIK